MKKHGKTQKVLENFRKIMEKRGKLLENVEIYKKRGKL